MTNIPVTFSITATLLAPISAFSEYQPEQQVVHDECVDEAMDSAITDKEQATLIEQCK